MSSSDRLTECRHSSTSTPKKARGALAARPRTEGTTRRVYALSDLPTTADQMRFVASRDVKNTQESHVEKRVICSTGQEKAGWVTS